jgi:hypothetical protein
MLLVNCNKFTYHKGHTALVTTHITLSPDILGQHESRLATGLRQNNARSPAAVDACRRLTYAALLRPQFAHRNNARSPVMIVVCGQIACATLLLRHEVTHRNDGCSPVMVVVCGWLANVASLRHSCAGGSHTQRCCAFDMLGEV